MSKQLKVTLGQYSDKGRKTHNQDFHGACVPAEPLLGSKGIAVALADGISSSQVSQVASEAAVAGFLEDYFCTSEAWSVKKSAQRVLVATNSWLHAQTRRSEFRFEADRGFVCTFSALVLKAATAHLFHIGDSRIYRLRDSGFECLTQEHRFHASREQSYLARALGMNSHLEIDYQVLDVAEGDLFLLVTDGVYEWLPDRTLAELIHAGSSNLETAAKKLCDTALARGSGDNLTAQLVRIDSLPERDAHEAYRQLTDLPLPPMLEARMSFEGFRIERQLHASSRSHVFLATDEASGEQVVVKIPAADLRDTPEYLDKFMLEDWIARRIQSPHVLKPWALTRRQQTLYTVTEYVQGQTLEQWLTDNPRPALETVRDIIAQIARGLRAMHRLEMLHQDLRPQNIMIDNSGTVKLIDFGSVRVAGLEELHDSFASNPIPGAVAYMAPEYFLGETPSTRCDQFALGVITYQMLSGALPYGAEIPKCSSRKAMQRLHYRPIHDADQSFPDWVDEALKKATHLDPYKRYGDVSEFIHDLSHPNPAYLSRTRPPLMEQNPVAFWQATSSILLGLVVYLLYLLLYQGAL